MDHRYRKKPVVIEAFQMSRSARFNNCDWPEWLNTAWNLTRGDLFSVYPTEPGTRSGTVSIATLEGEMLVDFDSWIIKGVEGELYPCKPRIFAATYEEAGG